MKKENRIAFRVTDQEKRRIAVLAKKCGLSVSEYVKQRALGYAPQPVLPEVIFLLLEKIGQLQDLTASPETDAAICALLKEISDTLLLPRKEGVPCRYRILACKGPAESGAGLCGQSGQDHAPAVLRQRPLRHAEIRRQ